MSDSSRSQSRRQQRRGSASAASINLPLFRQHLACFLLLVRTFRSHTRPPAIRHTREQQYCIDRTGLPPLIDPPGRVASIRSSLRRLSRPIKALLRCFKRGLPERRQIGFEWHEFGSITGRLLLEGMLKEYPMPILIPFIDEFCSFAGSSVLSRMKQSGKVSTVASLVELFFSGTLPQSRRREERSVIRTINVEEFTTFEFCGISVPKEIFEWILEFSVFDYSLIVGLGSVSFPFFAGILSNWRSEIRVSESNVFSIPLTVLASKCLKDFEITTSVSSSSRLFRYLLETIPKSPKSTLRSLKFQNLNPISDFPNRTPQLLFRSILQEFSRSFRSSNRTQMFESLVVLSFQDSKSFDRNQSWRVRMNPKRDRTLCRYRLEKIAPNLEVVRWPDTLLWCLGLSKLRGLSVTSKLMLTRAKSAKLEERCDDILRQLTELEIWAFERSNEIIEKLMRLEIRNLQSLVLDWPDSSVRQPILDLFMESPIRETLSSFSILGHSVKCLTDPRFYSYLSSFPVIPTLPSLSSLYFSWKGLASLISPPDQLESIVNNNSLQSITFSLPFFDFSFENSRYVDAVSQRMKEATETLLERLPLLRRLKLRCLTQSVTIQKRTIQRTRVKIRIESPQPRGCAESGIPEDIPFRIRDAFHWFSDCLFPVDYGDGVKKNVTVRISDFFRDPTRESYFRMGSIERGVQQISRVLGVDAEERRQNGVELGRGATVFFWKEMQVD